MNLIELELQRSTEEKGRYAFVLPEEVARIFDTNEGCVVRLKDEHISYNMFAMPSILSLDVKGTARDVYRKLNTGKIVQTEKEAAERSE
jgi:hypothetical protein